MDNIEKIEEIKELFEEYASTQVFDTWADTFEIESIDKKRVVIAYYGEQRVKKFKRKCKKLLKACVRMATGKRKKIKIIRKKKIKKGGALKLFIIGMFFICLALGCILVMCNYIDNRNFRETFYSVSSIKVDSQVRVIQLSDLHRCSYGANNQQLLERIEELEPDIIICTGDMVDSVKNDLDYAVDFGKKLSQIAPSYYVYGNNEVEGIYNFPLNERELAKEDSFEEKLEETGIQVLKNEKDTIQIKTMTIDVYGVLTSNPSSFWSYSGESFSKYIYENPDNIKITAIHEPFIFEELQTEVWGDLMVCGHTHGGVIRVPVLGPLFTKEGGLFPERSGKFVYGRYDAEGRPLIVSSGLENSSVFRINNQPELVVIDINKF